MALSSSSENPNIAAFLKRNHIAVLATANKDNAIPHAAAIYYTTTSKFNFFFITKRETTKSRNLEGNPQAALVIYEAATQQTAQVEGIATQVNDPVRLKTALEIMAKFSKDTAGSPNLPIAKLNAGAYVLYKLVPQSIRLGDYKYGSGDYIFDTATVAEESLE